MERNIQTGEKMTFPTVKTKTVHELDGQQLVDWC